MKKDNQKPQEAVNLEQFDFEMKSQASNCDTNVGEGNVLNQNFENNDETPQANFDELEASFHQVKRERTMSQENIQLKIKRTLSQLSSTKN